MRKVVTLLIALLVAASVAHAHGGKPHLLGTVERLHENQLTVKDKDGKERTVELAATTKLEKGGKAATRADLVPGVRVSVHFGEDAKTASLIKISPAAPR